MLPLSVLATAAEAQSADYKALVCVFLYGGVDGNNLVIPMDSAGYAQYAAVRTTASGVNLAQSALLPIQPSNTSTPYGLHPDLAALHPLFAQRRLAILANVHVANRDWDKAIKHYEEAIETAGSLFDLGRTAKMYSGLSSAYRETGHVEAAVKYAGRSIALLEVLRDRVSLARAENNLGLILLAQGDRAGAHKHLDRSLELTEETNLEVGRSHVLMSLCELSLLKGNVQSARQFADQALAMAERLREPANIAEAHVWLGRIAAEVGEEELCDTEFAIAFRGLNDLGVEERLLRCHGIYAEILEKRGELKEAYEHMKKAFSASRPGLLHTSDDETEERATTA